MKRNLFLLLTVVVAVSLTGCVTVNKVVRERVDQDLAGNQGYLTGTSDTEAEPRPAEREYIDIKVELPTWGEMHSKPSKGIDESKSASKKTISNDTDAVGNKGYLTSSARDEEDLPVLSKRSPEAETVYEYDEIEVEIVSDDEVVFYKEEVIRPAYQEYTVKKGDTLSHIAKAFYDKASKWTVIYEANSDKLKDPSTVRPGMVLIIPNLDEAEPKYIK